MQNLREGLGKQNLESCLGAAQLVTARPQGTRSEVLSTHGRDRGLTVLQLGCSLNKEGKHHLPAPPAACALGCQRRSPGRRASRR